MAERRYTEQEVAEILRAAVDNQAASQSPADNAQGFSLADIERIANEVGIDARHVSLAAQTLGQAPLQKRRFSFWGAPIRQTFEYNLDGTLSPSAWEEVVADLRDRYGYNGTATQVGTTLEFSGEGDFLAVHFALTPRAGRTRVRAAVRQFEIVVLTWMLSFIFTFLSSIAAITALARAGHGSAGVAVAMCIAMFMIFTANRITTKFNRKIKNAVENSLAFMSEHMTQSVDQPSTIQSSEPEVLHQSSAQ